MVEEHPKPNAGESVLEYSERLNAMNIGSHQPVMTHFGLSRAAGKALWLASENFNARFSFEQWKSRRDSSADGYGARNWLKRHYKLSDVIADQVVAGFEAGNDRALLEALTFEQLARRLLTEQAQTELEKVGALGEPGAAEQ